jgi:hypothetical protein
VGEKDWVMKEYDRGDEYVALITCSSLFCLSFYRFIIFKTIWIKYFTLKLVVSFCIPILSSEICDSQFTHKTRKGEGMTHNSRHIIDMFN